MAAPPPPDSPLVRRFAVAAAVLAAVAVALVAVGAPADADAAAALAAAVLRGGALLLRRSRRRGEPVEQRRLVDGFGLAGEEDVLALGDPRLADAAAAHLPGGRAEAGALHGSELPYPA